MNAKKSKPIFKPIQIGHFNIFFPLRPDLKPIKRDPKDRYSTLKMITIARPGWFPLRSETKRDEWRPKWRPSQIRHLAFLDSPLLKLQDSANIELKVIKTNKIPLILTNNMKVTARKVL